MKELKVSAIRDGTVIDHIPAENTFKVVEVLQIDEMENVLTIASNLKSKQEGRKGIVKVGGLALCEKEVKKIALFAPEATLNIIKDFKVVKKEKLEIPDILENIVKCFNPDCATNIENVRTKFYVESKEPLRLRCHHCERIMSKDEVELV